MEAIFCNDKNKWNEFVLQNSGSVLQCFEWGEFQEKSNKKVLRIIAEDNKEVLAQAQVVKESFPFKNCFYIPFGPVFKSNISLVQKESALKILINKISELATKDSCIFLRIEPGLDNCNIAGNAPIKRIQPQKTLILDLTAPEEELFKSFSRTTKYNIGLAKRHGVKIIRQKEYSADFFNLMQGTKERQGFGIHTEEYYKNILKINGQAIKAELFFAEYENKKINTSLVLFFTDTAITLHAGSDYNYRQIKASNLLEWEIILATKKEGYKKLDFWGVDDKKWPGLTAFKKGFGGKEIEYPQGVEIVFQSFWYNVYKALKILRRK